jgi:hypothetical protein
MVLQLAETCAISSPSLPRNSRDSAGFCLCFFILCVGVRAHMHVLLHSVAGVAAIFGRRGLTSVRAPRCQLCGQALTHAYRFARKVNRGFSSPKFRIKIAASDHAS